MAKDDVTDDYKGKSTYLNKAKTDLDSHYTSIGITRSNYKVLINIDITPEIVKKSEDEPILVYLEEVSNKQSVNDYSLAALATRTDTKTGTYVCDGKLLYLSASLTANTNGEYVQLSNYSYAWSTNAPKRLDASNGFCTVYNVTTTIKQFGQSEGEGPLIALDDIIDSTDFDAQSGTFNKTWYNRTFTRLGATGALKAFSTFNIRTCKSCNNGQESGVFYYVVTNFMTGWGSLTGGF